jgi:hypothetical protein
MEQNQPESKDSLPEEKTGNKAPASKKAGLTKEDGVNAFLAGQDEKPRPEDILYDNPDDIENAEDIISSGVGSQ